MSGFQRLSGRRVDFSDVTDHSTVRRNNTVHLATGRRRYATEDAAAVVLDDEKPPPPHISGSESPLYAEANNLQRHTSLPNRSKATAWRGQSSMPALPRELLEDGDAFDEEGTVYGPSAAQWESLRGSSHQRSMSDADGSRSRSGSSPASPRTDVGVFASGAFASSLSTSTGVRRHQSLNLHQHSRQTSNFGPIGSPGKTRTYNSGRARVYSVGEEDKETPSYGSRTPWSPTPEEAIKLQTRQEHSGGSDDSHASLPNPSTQTKILEQNLANVRLEQPLSPSLAETAPSEEEVEVWAPSRSPVDAPRPPSRRNTPQLPPLVTSLGGSTSPSGAISASATVPWIGRNHATAPRDATHLSPAGPYGGSRGITASPGVTADLWAKERERLGRSVAIHSALPSTMGFPAQPVAQYYSAEQAQTAALLQQQQYQIQQLQAQVAARSNWTAPPQQPQIPPGLVNGHSPWPYAAHAVLPPTVTQHRATASNGSVQSPIDIQAFAQNKGFNPPPHLVDLQPVNARFFVIKSYTEEDVHKSIKYSIWTSTALGNKRLDKAFRENAELGKIFLFFSVNSSGHFCGVAEMLTPVDETIDATVWAQSKWKGVLKVRWLYIRDVPNSALRHLRLTNTAEAKPVTSSRDTQEVPYEVGLEILRIFSTYSSKTSLLQDYQFYEVLQLQRQLQAALTNGSGGQAAASENGAGAPVQSHPAPATANHAALQ